MDLVDRKYRILQAIIDDYILTALPVGSRTISRKYEQKLSSATIRNEMSDLEELGYLDSPHTSAGRVPSYKAYRLYVDQMIRPQSLSSEETAYIRDCFSRRMGQIDEMSTRVARALSSMTHYTSVVLTRSAHSEQVLSHLQLVPLSERQALLVLVLRGGQVRQCVVDTGAAMHADDLYAVSRYLSEKLAGCPLSMLSTALVDGIGGVPQEMEKVVRSMAEQGGEESKLVIGGRSNLLGFPEYSDAQKARALLSVLETREKMVDLLSGSGEMELSVRIGPETGIEEMRDCSLLTVSCRTGDGRVNTIGLIGPTRMQYGKALSVLETVGRTLTELLDEQNG